MSSNEQQYNNKQEPYLTDKEIEIVKLFYTMIKDTKDSFEEYFKLKNFNESEKRQCLESFINNLKAALGFED